MLERDRDGIKIEHELCKNKEHHHRNDGHKEPCVQADYGIKVFRNIVGTITMRSLKQYGVDLQHDERYIDQKYAPKRKGQIMHADAEQGCKCQKYAGAGDPIKDGAGIQKDLDAIVIRKHRFQQAPKNVREISHDLS